MRWSMASLFVAVVSFAGQATSKPITTIIQNHTSCAGSAWLITRGITKCSADDDRKIILLNCLDTQSNYYYYHVQEDVMDYFKFAADTARQTWPTRAKTSPREGDACSASCGWCGRCSPGDGLVEFHCVDCGGSVWIERDNEFPIGVRCEECQ